MQKARYPEQLARDLRYAARVMRRKATVASIAVLSLAIGLGANTAVFSFVNAIMLKRLPVPSAGRLVLVRYQSAQLHGDSAMLPYPFFRELRKQRESGFEDVLAVGTIHVNLTESNQTERLNAE